MTSQASGGGLMKSQKKCSGKGKFHIKIRALTLPYLFQTFWRIKALCVCKGLFWATCISCGLWAPGFSCKCQNQLGIFASQLHGQSRTAPWKFRASTAQALGVGKEEPGSSLEMLVEKEGKCLNCCLGITIGTWV